MGDFIRTFFVKASHKFEQWQRSSQASTFRFRPGVAIFTAATFFMVLQMWQTPRGELTDNDHVGLFLRERMELKRETDRQFKKLRYQYLQSQHENHKYFESDLTRLELQDLHEEASKRAKEIMRQRLLREEKKMDRLYGGMWYAIKRSMGLEQKPSAENELKINLGSHDDNNDGAETISVPQVANDKIFKEIKE